MNKAEIIQQLNKNHQSFTDYIASLSDEEFMFKHGDKWTAGQQLEHIYLGVKPLVLAFSLPKLFPRVLFGKANRPSKNYEGLVQKYQGVLAKGAKASGQFSPKAVAVNQKAEITKQVSGAVRKLTAKLDRFSEVDLDALLLPHPLLGKLTLREMLYFTVYHVQHHHEITKRNLSERRTQ